MIRFVMAEEIAVEFTIFNPILHSRYQSQAPIPIQNRKSQSINNCLEYMFSRHIVIVLVDTVLLIPIVL